MEDNEVKLNIVKTLQNIITILKEHRDKSENLEARIEILTLKVESLDAKVKVLNG